MQTYARLSTSTSPLEPAAQTLPTLQQQVDTLQNIVLTLQNPYFRQYYGYSATMGEIHLQAALARVLSHIDPLVLEALAAHDLLPQA
ncbi:hypothetical protein ACAW74_25870 [Fibrella sp. WM1]|uniref:hypothetical protein n=1 Tax=Fibrella musci TaxID=3242485 RepID=UPI00351FB889